MRLVGYCSRSIYCLTKIDNDSITYNVASKHSVKTVIRKNLLGSLLYCGLTVVGKRKLGVGSGGGRGSVVNGLVIGPLG